MLLQPAPNGAVFWVHEIIFFLFTCSLKSELIAAHNFSRLLWGWEEEYIFPHRNRTSVSKHILFSYTVGLSGRDTGEVVLNTAISPFLLSLSMSSEQSSSISCCPWMTFRSTERVNVFPVRESHRLVKDYPWNIGSKRISYLAKLMIHVKLGEEGGVKWLPQVKAVKTVRLV